MPTLIKTNNSSCPERESDKRPTVLEVRVVSGSGGGPDKTILNTPRFLEPCGYRVICAYMHPPDDPGFGALINKAAHWGADLRSIPDRGATDWNVVRQLRDLCRAENVTIWHAHDYKSNLLGLLIQHLHPVRLVTTAHGWGVMHDWKTRAFYRLDRSLLKYYELVMCVSEDLQKTALAHGVPPESCRWIPNAVDTTEFQRSLPTSDSDHGALHIGAAGRLSREKGFDLLIHAVGDLIESGADLRLSIAGVGDQQSVLEALIRERNLGDRVILAGYHENLVEFYNTLDMFVLSSLREGLPNVVLEALAMELPVIATAVAGIPGLIAHGQDGWIIPPDSRPALRDAVAHLANQPDLRRELGQAGRRTVLQNYDFARRMQTVARHFDILLGRQRQP